MWCFILVWVDINRRFQGQSSTNKQPLLEHIPPAIPEHMTCSTCVFTRRCRFGTMQSMWSQELSGCCCSSSVSLLSTEAGRWKLREEGKGGYSKSLSLSVVNERPRFWQWPCNLGVFMFRGKTWHHRLWLPWVHFTLSESPLLSCFAVRGGVSAHTSAR